MEELKPIMGSGAVTIPMFTTSGEASFTPPSPPDVLDPNEWAENLHDLWDFVCRMLDVDPGSAQEALSRLIDLISLWRQAETADAVA